MFNDVDFLDVVAVAFGLILLAAVIAQVFLGMTPDTDIKSWFFAILTFIIGKKALPQTLGK